MSTPKLQRITVVNKLTGEVYELTYSTIQEALESYLIVKGMLDALERAKTKLTAYIAATTENSIDFDNGYTGQWIQPSRKRYLPETVRKYLDEDQLALVTDINGMKLKSLLKQLVEDGRGIPGAWNDIEATAELLPTKPYFVIRKGN